jgi:hypothetical protein
MMTEDWSFSFVDALKGIFRDVGITTYQKSLKLLKWIDLGE